VYCLSSKKAVREVQKEGKVCVLDIDMQVGIIYCEFSCSDESLYCVYLFKIIVFHNV